MTTPKKGAAQTRHPETAILHDGRDPARQHGFVNPPAYRGSTVLFPTLDALEAYDEQPFRYGRHGTPTTAALEDAIHREVREEVGVEVEGLEYFSSQSWPFPNSLMIAFTARWKAGEIAADPAEIADARWFDLDALPEMPPPGVSISRALIDATVQRLRSTRA